MSSMGRNAHFTDEQFVDAALKIAAGDGPAAVTVAAIAREVGAPVGSVYHRFPSLDTMLAEVWLRVVSMFQEGFLEALETGGGLHAALFTPQWVRSHPAEARILLLYRREELAGENWPDAVKSRARRVAGDLDLGIRKFVVRLSGAYDRDFAERAVFAVIDAPYAAVIRHIRLGRKPPVTADEYIRQTYSAIMGGNDENLQPA